MAFPQTSYSMDPRRAKLGMVRSLKDCRIKAYPAAADGIQPGDLLERVIDGTSGQPVVRVAQSANGALKDLAGVAMYRATQAPRLVSGTVVTGYLKGEMVPCVQRGEVYAKWLSTDGSTAQVPFTAPNYAHSTTLSAEQGAFTDKATASTATHEVDAAPTGVKLGTDQTADLGFGICLVELNLP